MKILNIIALLVCGVSIGWLLGLSSSPIIETVIGSLLAIITTLMTLLFSVEKGSVKDKISDKLGTISILPLSIFLLGLSTSATVGIYARTNDWFGIDPQSFKQKWEAKDKDPSGIINALYNELHKQDAKGKSTNNINQGVLFGNSEKCDELLQIDNIDVLTNGLQVLSPEWQLFVDSVITNVSKEEQLQVLRQKIIQNCK